MTISVEQSASDDSNTCFIHLRITLIQHSPHSEYSSYNRQPRTIKKKSASQSEYLLDMI